MTCVFRCLFGGAPVPGGPPCCVRCIQVMEKLLKDGSTMVLGSAVAAFTEVSLRPRPRIAPAR